MSESVPIKKMSFVCGTCLHWTRAVEQNADADRCLAAQGGNDCGGPLVGMDFPEYVGALEGAGWTKCCFLCGKDSDAYVGLEKKQRVFGICSEHLRMFHDFVPVGGEFRRQRVRHETVNLIR